MTWVLTLYCRSNIFWNIGLTDLNSMAHWLVALCKDRNFPCAPPPQQNLLQQFQGQISFHPSCSTHSTHNSHMHISIGTKGKDRMECFTPADMLWLEHTPDHWKHMPGSCSGLTHPKEVLTHNTWPWCGSTAIVNMWRWHWSGEGCSAHFCTHKPGLGAQLNSSQIPRMQFLDKSSSWPALQKPNLLCCKFLLPFLSHLEALNTF
jgi:hypothetical protein